jgi:hypothetical protein
VKIGPTAKERLREGVVPVVIPTSDDLDVLRAVVRAGFDRDETVRLCDAAGWELVEELPESQLHQFSATFGDLSDMIVTFHCDTDIIAPTANAPLWLTRKDEQTRLNREFQRATKS